MSRPAPSPENRHAAKAPGARASREPREGALGFAAGLAEPGTAEGGTAGLPQVHRPAAG